MIWLLRKLILAHGLIDYAGASDQGTSVQKLLMEAQQDFFRLAEVYGKEPDGDAAFASRARELAQEIEKEIVPLTYDVTKKIDNLTMRAAALVAEVEGVKE